MILKPKDLEKYFTTSNEGTRDNPKVNKLPRNYKLALYLGFKLKWDYSWFTRVEYHPKYVTTAVYELSPIFKLSHQAFYFYWSRDWSYIMTYILPKMREDNLINEELEEEILKFDLDSVSLLINNIIDKHIPDMENPFKFTDDFVEKSY
jgi:hypothetical protein